MARYPAPFRYEICAISIDGFLLQDPVTISPRAASHQNVSAFLSFADEIAAEAARVREYESQLSFEEKL